MERPLIVRQRRCPDTGHRLRYDHAAGRLTFGIFVTPLQAPRPVRPPSCRGAFLTARRAAVDFRSMRPSLDVLRDNNA